MMVARIRGLGKTRDNCRKDEPNGVFLVVAREFISTVDERESLKCATLRYCYTILTNGGEADWSLKKKRNGKKARKRSGKKRSGKPFKKVSLCIFLLCSVYAFLIGLFPDIGPYL